MALSITRRVGQSFTLTWPNGAERVFTVTDIAGSAARLGGVWVDHDAAHLATVDRHTDTAIIRSGLTFNPQQVKIIIDAPRSIRVLRDDAIVKEPKQ